MNNISEKVKLCAEPFVHSKLDMTCGNCTTNPMIVPNNMIYLANINIDDLEEKKFHYKHSDTGKYEKKYR